MSGAESQGPQDKRALYWLGERLIDHRHWISVLVILVTAVFAYWSFQLKLETSFGDLLPQTHPFVRVHNKYSGTFGGANNIQLMVEVNKGDIFTVPTLARIFRITQEMDKVYGVNHNQIDSIGHRTTRYLRVAAGGTLRAEPVMITIPKTAGDAAAIKRIVHDTESIYGILVSLDDKAALVRANFIEARLDHRRTFREINERVITPFERGWIGAMIKGTNPLRLEEPAPAIVERVYRGTPAAAAGLARGDVIVAVNGAVVRDRVELGKAIAAHRPGDRLHLTVVRGGVGRLLRRVRSFTVGGRELRDWPALARELAARAAVAGKIEVTVARRGVGDEPPPPPEVVPLTAAPTDLTVVEPDIHIYVAGEPRLYGWIYRYAGDVFWILVVTYCLEWLLRWFYFHDWRGSLRPTLTGVVAAFWGLGFVHVIGLALDPLILVMPFLITARAVSHAIQMHERYYEEYHRQNWDKRRAIVAAFAELFVPTLSGISTDALGVLAILLVPVVMLQKLAIVASFWIAAITVAELLLNPIVYYYLRAPDQDVVLSREQGWFRRAVEWATDHTLSPRGRRVTLVVWVAAALLAASFMPRLIVGDPTAASPLVWLDSPYNVSHRHIQEKFGGVEPLIVVTEGHDKNAMKDPATLHTMEKFQRYLEGDPDVGYSFSLVDILRAVNMVFHEMEPKWGVIPNNWVDVGSLFFIFFSGSPPTETAKYVDASYTTAHVTFFCKNHKGDTIRRVIHRCNTFIGETAREQLGFTAAAGDGAVRVASVVPGGLAAKYGLKPGDVILDAEPLPLPAKGLLGRAHDAIRRAVFGWPVRTLDDLNVRLRDAVASPSGLRFEVRRGGAVEPVVVSEAPSKAAFKLAGGLIGVLAAANQALVGNDVLMNILGFGTIYIIVLFTYRSWAAGLYLLAPLLLANMVINAYMAARGIGINVNTLPLVTVGVGFGIDYGLYIVSRVIEEVRVSGDLESAMRQALVTSGKAVSFTAVAMVTSTFMWVFSNIRFDAEMGGLLALWMLISFLGAETLLPVLVVVLRPRFIVREAARARAGRERAAAAS